MQTTLADFLRDTPEGDEAQAILGKCVHCGFCTATCPTYQILGDELDGPRGRIYLMKQMMEGAPVTASTQEHLDRCLTCRNCESTCPSGVKYSRLLDIGRHIVEEKVPRSAGQRALRWSLKEGMTRPTLFANAMRMGRLVRPLLPAALKEKVPPLIKPGIIPIRHHTRKMLLLDGCVQPALSPNINAAARRVLDRLGVELIVAPKAGCCGAVRHHLNDQDGALSEMRRNIDAWWPEIEAGVETLLMTASGCGATIKEYGYLLRHDTQYAAKAEKISALCKDLSEVLPEFSDALQALRQYAPDVKRERIAYHPPCTLQHGLQIRGKVEKLLTDLGIDIELCADSHLCCGSAGTYSILQADLSHQLRANKLAALLALKPQRIVSANIGCQTHLQAGTDTPVEHWIELVDRLLAPQTTLNTALRQ